MASTALNLHTPDTIKRRVMFALELVDPVTGRLASEGMVVTAPGLAPPVLSPSGRFVWIDVDPPAKRAMKIKAESKRRIFAPLEEEFEVPARGPGVSAMVKPLQLVPTGLYEPPAGMLAVAGMLIDTAADRNGLPAVSVNLRLYEVVPGDTIPSPDDVTNDYFGRTDERGLFVAVVRNAVLKMLVPGGSLYGWLAFTNAAHETRYTRLLPPGKDPLPLPKNRLLRLPEPLVWDVLQNDSPPPPPPPTPSETRWNRS
jgi:hypothetical protein